MENFHNFHRELSVNYGLGTHEDYIIPDVSFDNHLDGEYELLKNNASRVETLRRNRSKNCRFWSTFVDFVGFLCRKCRLSTFSSVLSVLAVRNVDYRHFLSVFSVSICFKYKRIRVRLRDKWCSGGEGG